MTYALKVSGPELGRYQMMADRAKASEAKLWPTAGIVPGAIVGLLKPR